MCFELSILRTIAITYLLDLGLGVPRRILGGSARQLDTVTMLDILLILNQIDHVSTVVLFRQILQYLRLLEVCIVIYIVFVMSVFWLIERQVFRDSIIVFVKSELLLWLGELLVVGDFMLVVGEVRENRRSGRGGGQGRYIGVVE